MSWGTYKGGNEGGSIFIKSVCDVLNDAYKDLPNNMSLTKMLMKIRQNVSNSKKQISEPIFTMNKEMFFLPKDVSQFL